MLDIICMVVEPTCVYDEPAKALFDLRLIDCCDGILSSL